MKTKTAKQKSFKRIQDAVNLVSSYMGEADFTVGVPEDVHAQWLRIRSICGEQFNREWNNETSTDQH